MALLETIRQQTDSPWAKVIFGAVVLVFIFWGIGASGGPTTQAVAEVNGERITDTQLQRAVRNITRGGAGLNEDQLQEATQYAIDALVMQELLQQEVNRLGIEVSDEEIARYVLQYDAFKDDSGKFSKKLYERQLKNFGLSSGKFEEQARQQLAIEKLEALARASVIISDSELKTTYALANTQVSLDMVRITDNALLDLIKVEDAAISDYIAANGDELRQIYDKDYERLYHQPPRATVHQIRLRTDIEGFTPEAVREKLAAIRAEASSAADPAAAFADLARRYSEDFSASTGGTMGPQAEAQLPEPARQPIFSAAPGTITDIVELDKSLVIYRVEDRSEEVTRTFEDVQRDIARQELARQQLPTFASTVAEEILAAWKQSGSAPTAILEKYSLSVQAVGPLPKGQPSIPGAGTSEGLTAALAATSAAGLLDGVYRTDGGRIIAAVTDYQAPSDEDFDKEKGIIRAQLLQLRQEEFLEAWRQDLRKRATVVQHYQP